MTHEETEILRKFERHVIAVLPFEPELSVATFIFAVNVSKLMPACGLSGEAQNFWKCEANAMSIHAEGRNARCSTSCSFVNGSSKMTQEQSLLRTMLVHALTREQKTLKKIPLS